MYLVFQLLTTADEVAKLQEELETMRPLLDEAVQESIVTMEKITVDTVSSVPHKDNIRVFYTTHIDKR